MEPRRVAVLEKWNQSRAGSDGREPIRRSATRYLPDFACKMRLVVVAGIECERRPIHARGNARLRQHLTHPSHPREHLRWYAHVPGECAGQMLARDAERWSERRDREVPTGTQNGTHRGVHRTILALRPLESAQEQSLERSPPSSEGCQLSAC